MASTMLDHEITMSEDDWRTTWLERTLRPLHCYTNGISYALSLTIIALGLAGYISIRRATKQLTANPSHRAEITSKMHKKVLKVTRGEFVVAKIYLLHVLILTLVDAFVCVTALRDDVKSDPDAWTGELVTSISMYCVYLFAIFAIVFFLLPFLQIVLFTKLLVRFSNKQGGTNILSEYTPEVRFLSTHLALAWCMAAFFVTAFWSPASDSSFWRFVVLQGSIGSAIAWLQISFVFNFRFENLEDVDVAAGGAKDLLRMFRKTARVVRVYKVAEDALPRYEDVPASDRDEKAVLVETVPLQKSSKLREQAGSGCLICAAREKSCDEAAPVCQSCERGGFDCVW